MTKQWRIVMVALMAVLWQPRAEAVIVINEVLADPPSLGGDANGDGVISSTRDEFVELVNTNAAGISLAGWTLSDDVQVRHIFAPGALIPGGGFFVVFGGGAPQGFSHAAIASSGGLSLNNAGDQVTLRDAQAFLIDAFVYGTEGGHDVSLTRSPDATGPVALHSSVSPLAFSPGRTIGGQPQLPQEQETSSGTIPPVVPTMPEPSSVFLLGAGLWGIAMRHRRIRQCRPFRPSTL